MVGGTYVSLRGVRPPSPYGFGFEMDVDCPRNSRNDYLRYIFSQYQQSRELRFKYEENTMTRHMIGGELERIDQSLQLLTKVDHHDIPLNTRVMKQLSEAYQYCFERLPGVHMHREHISEMHNRMGGDPFYDVDDYSDYEPSDADMEVDGGEE